MIDIQVGVCKSKKFSIHMRMFVCAFFCVGFFTSCYQKETFTDVYYIHNVLEDSVTFMFGSQLYYDTCSQANTASYPQVWFTTGSVTINAGKTIRLHPVCRGSYVPSAHQLNPISIIGSHTKLITNTDTIDWLSAYVDRPPSRIPVMFSSDTIWSIYNTKSWQTEQDVKQPNTNYHTFTVTERNKVL